MGANDSQLELAHVLFIDIVGYSKHLINEQTTLVKHLNELVLQTAQCRTADAAGKLIRIPTGDGIALAFFTSPDAPVRCAMELSKTVGQAFLPAASDQRQAGTLALQLRMGIHTGPVDQVTDVNQRSNVTGAGINMAQRVMDCGDAGHILLSKHIAEDLEHYGHWQSLLHDLGECEVKHGVRVGVVNFYGDSVGNPQLPKKFLARKKRQTRNRWLAVAASLFLISVIVAALVIFSKKTGRTAASVPEKSIAVLPFENLSDDKANAYFADGIQDEVLTKLASIADLKVISRTSTAKYKSKPEDLKTVSQQLGVANVLEGTVQRAADKVRVNVQLIDARADAHLWAKTYDRDVKDVFAVESEVSQEIADALQAKLSPSEVNTLSTAPTRDPVAYDLFLKGEFEDREAASSLTIEAYEQAANWYQQAIAHDPTFALAMARLVRSQMSRHWLVQPMTESQLAEVKTTADRAFTLAPNLAETHVALGAFYYFGHRQYEEALAEFQKAIQLQPNNAEAAEFCAFVHRRQGKWQECLTELLKSKEKDPLNAPVAADIGATYVQLRMWKEAKEAAAHTLEINPHNVVAMRVSLISCRNGSGDLTEAKRLLATFPKDPDLTVTRPGVAPLVGERAYLSVIERDFRAALEAWANETGGPAEKRKRLSARSAIGVLSGDTSNVKTDAEEAHILIDSWLADHPSDEIALVELSWVDLALNRPVEAVQTAQRAADLITVEKDPFLGTSALVTLAEVQARCGRAEEAIKILQRLLSIPAGFDVSIVRLKIDPVWDPIRNDPGFQELLTAKELVGTGK
jgi:TolB-like protein/class 3 adenylate cyclase/Tfp pilus assembly protein PilF